MMQLKILLSMMAVLTLSACSQGPKDSDRILDAQNCLDTATSETAHTCMEKVDGIESESAYRIRCVGKFIIEGFDDTSKITAALDALKTGGNGAAGSLSMMAALAFTSESTEVANATSAELTLNYCNNANSKGLIFLAGLAQTSTTLAKLSNSLDLSDPASLNGTNLEAAMTALKGDSTAQTAVGNAIVSIYESSCTGSEGSTGNYCQQFESVVTSVSGGISNPKGIGQQIMKCYTTPSTPGCTGF